MTEKTVVKLTSLKADLEKELAGQWMPSLALPGVEFNVSSLHVPAYVTARDLMTMRLARKYKGEPVPSAERTSAIGKLYAKHILHGWRGFDVEYTPETALEVLTNPEYRLVVAEVESCAARLGEPDIEFLRDTEKNSAPPSAGS